MERVILTKKVLVISYQIGEEEGEPILKRERYSNINVEASDENLIAFATAVSSLKDYPVVRLYLEEEKSLVA